MFKSIQAFEAEWTNETAATEKLLAALTDESLSQRITPNNRSLGQLGAHLVTSIHEMLTRTGLSFETPLGHDQIPVSVSEITQAYRKTSDAMLQAIRSQWTDESLALLSEMYGEQWPNGLTLRILIQHEVHHRGQMTVLMRQAGLRVPGMYGPALEDWSEWGMEPPVV
jgi:uncharacterized damage-inducible protein DinB